MIVKENQVLRNFWVHPNGGPIVASIILCAYIMFLSEMRSSTRRLWAEHHTSTFPKLASLELGCAYMCYWEKLRPSSILSQLVEDCWHCHHTGTSYFPRITQRKEHRHFETHYTSTDNDGSHTSMHFLRHLLIKDGFSPDILIYGKLSTGI